MRAVAATSSAVGQKGWGGRHQQVVVVVQDVPPLQDVEGEAAQACPVQACGQPNEKRHVMNICQVHQYKVGTKSQRGHQAGPGDAEFSHEH